MLKFEIIQHSFTPNILDILRRHYGDYAEDVFQASPVLGYLNNKTKSANQGSKARGAFAITMRYMLWLRITYRRVLLKVKQKYPTQNTKARSSLICLGGSASFHSVQSFKTMHSMHV